MEANKKFTVICSQFTEPSFKIMNYPELTTVNR